MTYIDSRTEEPPDYQDEPAMSVADLPADIKAALRSAQSHKVYAETYVAVTTERLRRTHTTEERRRIIAEISRAKAALRKVTDALAPYAYLKGFESTP